MLHLETAANPWNLGIITDPLDMDLSRVFSAFYPKYRLRWAGIRDLQLDGKSRYVTNANRSSVRYALMKKL